LERSFLRQSSEFRPIFCEDGIGTAPGDKFMLRPLITVSNSSSSNILVKWLRAGSERSEKVFRRQDVEMIFQELRDSGGSEDIDQDDSEILHNVLELSNKRVRETMVPRTEMVAIDKTFTLEELKNMFHLLRVLQNSGITGYHIDDVIGVVFAYDLFNEPERDQ
jgi:putative hemolysin